ncbi:four helix bundle protein [Patescibacteria group bacterium]|nr:four helix bundle protein [Patescibacteria group bacterium]
MIHAFYELYKTFHKYNNKFPKIEKYNLGHKIECLILEMTELTFKALYAPKNEKLKTVKNLSNKNDLLRLLIRLCYDLELIDQKKYLKIQKVLQKTGEMIGGWLKHLNIERR